MREPDAPSPDVVGLDDTERRRVLLASVPRDGRVYERESTPDGFVWAPVGEAAHEGGAVHVAILAPSVRTRELFLAAEADLRARVQQLEALVVDMDAAHAAFEAAPSPEREAACERAYGAILAEAGRVNARVLNEAFAAAAAERGPTS